MILYYTPGTCSFAPHILLNELGFDFKILKVDPKTKKVEDGSDFYSVSSNGYVPALKLDDGTILTEGVAIMQYLADLKPETGLAPKLGSMERYQLMSMMNFITSELHKAFGPLFALDRMVQNPEGAAQLKKFTKDNLERRFEFVAKILSEKTFMMGDKMTIADVYLVTVLRWTRYVGMSLDAWPAITGFMGRMHDRASVQKAIKAEGLKG